MMEAPFRQMPVLVISPNTASFDYRRSRVSYCPTPAQGSIALAGSKQGCPDCPVDTTLTCCATSRVSLTSVEKMVFLSAALLLLSAATAPVTGYVYNRVDSRN